MMMVLSDVVGLLWSLVVDLVVGMEVSFLWIVLFRLRFAGWVCYTVLRVVNV
jgi:hypothetical protein